MVTSSATATSLREHSFTSWCKNGLNSLIALNLGWNDITSQDINPLKALANNKQPPQLRSLNLEFNHLDNTCVQGLSALLHPESSLSLEHLNLAYNCLTEQWCIAAAKILRQNLSLDRLIINGKKTVS